MSPVSKYTEHVEKVFLLELIAQLENGSLDLHAGQQQTKAFLSLQPFTSVDEMSSKLKTFTNNYQGFHKVYIEFLKHEEKEKTAEVQSKILKHIKTL